MPERKISEKGFLAGSIAAVVTLILLLIMVITITTSPLESQVGENKDQIKVHTEQIQTLKTANALNSEQHMRMENKLDKILIKIDKLRSQ